MIEKNSILNIAIFFLALAFSLHTQALNFYPIFDKVGSVADYILAKSEEIDQEDVQLFHKVAQELGVENRNIKVKNSGALLRLATIYSNALSIQLFNQVYLNKSKLKTCNRREKRFLMRRGLAYHSKNDGWKTILEKYLSRGINT